MKLIHKQGKPIWWEETSFFLLNFLINVLLVIFVLLYCIWFPFGWAFKKCRAWLKRPVTDKTEHILPIAVSLWML